MGRFGKRRMCALLCGLSSVFCDFGQALAKEGTGAINRKLRKQNMIGENVDMRKIDNGKVVKVVEKNQVEKTFAEKGYEWVMNNKKKSLLLTALLADSAWRGVNEIHLSTIYKKLDEQNYENGGCSASVKRYVYRYGNGKDPKSLVIKSINRLWPGDYPGFWGEQFAYEVIPELAEQNKNLAKIIDYHYGLTHNYVVYEDVGADHDWKNEMATWDEDRKFAWLEDVINQMVDVNLFLYNKGYYHGDFKLDNLSIVKNEDDGKPLVKIFDYGFFHRIKSWLGIPQPTVGTSSLFRFPVTFFDICSQVLLGAKRVRYYGQFDAWWNEEKYDKAEKIRKKNRVTLCKKYAERPLIKKIAYLYDRVKFLGSFINHDYFRQILSDFRNGAGAM